MITMRLHIELQPHQYDSIGWFADADRVEDYINEFIIYEFDRDTYRELAEVYDSLAMFDIRGCDYWEDTVD